MGIIIKKCTEVERENATENCASEEEIEAGITKTAFGFFYKNYFLDTSVFDENPVKNVIKLLYYPLLPDIAQSYFYGLKKNVGYIDDNWFGFGQGREYQYYTLDLLQDYMMSTSENPFLSGHRLLAFHFFEHEDEAVLIRNHNTLFDLLSDFGGFLEIIFFSTSIFVFAIEKFYF